MKIVFQALVIYMLSYAGVSSAAPPSYKWVDEQGNTHYTATPPPESSAHDRSVIGKQGRVLQTIQGQMTPERKAAYEKELLAEEQAAKALAKQKKRDRNLLISYKAEEEIVNQRDSKLSTLGDYIKSLEKDRDATGQEYKALLNQAVQRERTGKAPSEKLKANLRSAKGELDDHKANIEKAKRERLKASEKFEEDIMRFRELKGKGSAPHSR